MLRLRALCFLTLLPTVCGFARADQTLRAGFAHADITPHVKGRKAVYLAGYGFNRPATGVHDPLYARGLVLDDGRRKIALVSVDLVGLQYPAVKRIRKALPEIDYTLVCSTHNHEGPDVIGIWGPTPLDRGVDPDYLRRVVDQVVDVVRRAAKSAAPVDAFYGTAEDESLLGDSRLPKVYDGVLRVLRLNKTGTTMAAGLLVQWNCHPEALGSRNTRVTADFVAATVAALEKQHGCPVAYFSGALGGLMAPPGGRIKDAQGRELKRGQFDYSEAYGRAVAALASQAVGRAAPVRLSPLVVSARPIAVPMDNGIYKTYQVAGVLTRPALLWKGDSDRLGGVARLTGLLKPLAVETEVAYLRLGEVHVACLPGELYPELVYGKFQDPADRGADFPRAPLETPVMNILPGNKALILGLANDEIGYIIPKRQWDARAPYCYNRRTSQYGEINSCSPDAAPVIMEALRRRVREADKQPAAK